MDIAQRTQRFLATIKRLHSLARPADLARADAADASAQLRPVASAPLGEPAVPAAALALGDLAACAAAARRLIQALLAAVTQRCPGALLGQRDALGAPARQLALPANRLLFWVGLGDLKVTRSDLSSLIVEKPAGFLSGYDWGFRAEWHPLQLQQEIELDRVVITIQGQTRDRRPNRVQFRFKQALEAEQAHWLVWQHGRFERWQLPAVGQTRWYRSTLR